MLYTKSLMFRALTNYLNYQPTASDYFVECRRRHIPATIRKASQKKAIRLICQGIFDGSMTYTGRNHPYHSMREEHQVAVALVLIQGWAEWAYANMAQGRTVESDQYTDRVFKFLGSIQLDHATVAVRNWGHRDGGMPALTIINKIDAAKTKSFMDLYLKIRRQMSTQKTDWERRECEEKAGNFVNRPS